MLQNKINKLKEILQKIPQPINIACSGGLDSRLLAFFAKQNGFEINLFHVRGQHIDSGETKYLENFAKQNNMSLTFINFDLFQYQFLRENHFERCYYCKFEVFSTMLKACNGQNLCDGTHFDDTKSHRPGLKALAELNIISPFALSGFSKAELRQLALKIQLENPHQQAKPCLLTRFRYNAKISEQKLKFIELTEQNLQILLNEKYKMTPPFRIREVDENKFEIHCTESLDLSVIQALQTYIKQEATAGNYDLGFRKLEVLSGFFDLKDEKKMLNLKGD